MIDRHPGPLAGSNAQALTQVQAIGAGATSRGGQSLANLGFRYVILMNRQVPKRRSYPIPFAVQTAFASQLDLRLVDSVGGITVYETPITAASADRSRGVPIRRTGPRTTLLVLSSLLWSAALIGGRRRFGLSFPTPVAMNETMKPDPTAVDNVPTEVPPSDAIPDGAISSDAIPGGAIPDGAIPDGAISGDAISGDLTAEDEVSISPSSSGPDQGDESP